MLRAAFQWSATKSRSLRPSPEIRCFTCRLGARPWHWYEHRRLLKNQKYLRKGSASSAVHRPVLPSRVSVTTMTRAPDAFAVAPMMDVTDHHFRTLCRMISKRSVLYTEMVVDSTLKHNSESAGRWLAYAPEQQPLVLQLGGSEPEQMQLAAHIAAAYKYTAVNLNCGCPSDRVAGRGCFGASLMKDAARVAALCQAMATSLPSDTPVTVKCRLGVDDLDSYQFVHDFVDTVSSRAPVRHFIVHARKAWLKGLSPAENRTVPPLWYDRVFALRNDFPHLRFSINGGVRTLEQVLHFLDEESLYGVMLGRAVMEHPWETLGGVDALIYGDHGTAQQTRRDVLQAYGEYVDEIIRSAAVAGHSEQSAEQKRFCGRFPNPSLHLLLKPVMNLFWSIPRSKDWRKMVQQTTEEQSRAMRNGQIPSDFSWATFLIQAAEDTLDSWYLDATWMEEQARKRAASFTASNESCSQETEPLLAMHHALETFASSVLP